MSTSEFLASKGSLEKVLSYLMNFVLSNFQRWYSFSHLEVANSFTMFILSFGVASLAILRNRLTKGTLSYSILTTQWIHVKKVLHVLG